ncbi:MAG TPA: hypothetical protein PKH69_10250 [Thiobacillaceae bacterium]|nr:hypothetical protein [Thiobacillaceae bacterium]HNU64858.1 hypothetical protein [Thiobacillaceae bacterium]
MIRLLSRLGLLLVLPLAVLALLLALATSPAPAPGLSTALSVADMERGRRVWQILRPTHLREGQSSRISLSAQDLSLGLHYLARRMGLSGASATMQARHLTLHVTARIPGLPVPRYCNLALTLRPDGDLLAPARLRLGALPLPAQPARHLLEWGLNLSALGGQYAVARAMLRSAQLRDDRLWIDFVWHGRALENAVSKGMGLDMAALEAYRHHLTGQREREFTPLLGRAFSLAVARSRRGDPVRENRAALTALAERVLGTRLTSVGGVSRARQAGGGVRLDGRADFAQHFALSAFLAATGGTDFSDAAGLYKELRDARQGSGFSFNDLAADRAGSRLGNAATRSARDARRIQTALAGTTHAGAFFPRVDDLPQFMPQREFEGRFGGIDTPAYQAMLERIDSRISSLPLYRRGNSE